VNTTVCIVGAGPAGMILAYLLARKGVDVTVIEAQEDFDRDFRGDTLHPTTMELMEQLGLVEKLLKLPHTLVKEAIFHTPQGVTKAGDLSHLPTKYPYITLMPQSDFLEFMSAECKRFANFHLLMKTRLTELVKEGEKVVGVRVACVDEEQEIRANLVVGADGRFSQTRKLLGKDFQKKDVPLDILWFKLPKLEGEDVSGIGAFFTPGHVLVELQRHDHWQLGFLIPKGSFSKLQKEGLEAFKAEIVKMDPRLKEKVKVLTDWKQLGFLPVECGQVEKWYEEGILLIGDAAHVMSPVGGVGINYAIQDAVETANVLTEPLLKGELTVDHLAIFQQKRKWPTWAVLTFQNFAHQRVIKQVLDASKPLSVPFFMKWMWVRKLVILFSAMGIWRVRLKA
jgi:2-polyprenyl-6-methoxyphenol hydroxylase-like FAD-dependent oxidoreductase